MHISTFVVLIVAVGALLGVLPHYAGLASVPEVNIAPLSPSESPQAAALNAAIMVLLAAAYAVALLFIIRRRRLFLILMSSVWLYTTFVLAVFFAYVYYNAGLLPAVAALALMLASPVLGALAALMVFRRGDSPLFGLLAALTGVLLAYALPKTSIVAILAALAAYDYIAVRWGPLGWLIDSLQCCKKCAKEGGSPLPGLLVRVKDRAMGVGDFMIYSMAVTFAAIEALKFGTAISLAVFSAELALLYIGLRLTLRLVEKEGKAAGLPIPITLMIPLAFVTWAIGM